MRDAHRLRDRVTRGLSHNRVVWLTLAGVLSVGATFAAGFSVGRRAARLEASEELSANLPAASNNHAAADPNAAHDDLTFYAQLTATPPRQPQAAAPANKPSAPIAPAPATRPSLATAADHAPSGLTEALQRGPAVAGEYTVQVSSFQTKEEAKAFSSALERKGLKPFVVSAELPNKGTWYRVRIGRFLSEDQALQAKGVLAKADIPAWVLRSE